MPKWNTHEGTKKVLNVRQSGSIKIGHPGTRHNTGKKNAASNREGRAQNALHKTDYKRIKRLINN